MARTNKQPEAAAEQELQKAEVEYHHLHPLATQGNDVSPVTRGELRIILEDLLVKIGSGVPIATSPAPAAPTIDTSGADQLLSLGRDAMLQFAKDNNIDVSGVLGLDDTALAGFIAASKNVA